MTPDSSPLAEADENVARLSSDQNIVSILNNESTKLADLKESRAELLSRVQNLKKDLQDWRGKLESQVQNYRQELGELRNTLNTEVDQLRNEFQDLRNSIKKQLDATSNLSKQFSDLQVKEASPISLGQNQDIVQK